MASNFSAQEALNLVAEGIEALISEVGENIKKVNQHSRIWDSIKEFIAAVDWTERWIQALLTTHVTLLVLVLLFRKNQLFQGVVFCTIMLLVYFAERLNAVLAGHWEKFATQPYFDKHGIFMSAVYSTPLVFIMFVILINYLIATSDLLIKMKRKQLRFEARQRGLAEQQAGGASASGTNTAEEPKKDK